jgi:hypothetical protein
LGENFGKVTILVPGYLILEINHQEVLGKLKHIKKGHRNNFGNLTALVPQKSEVYKIGPCDILVTKPNGPL